MGRKKTSCISLVSLSQKSVFSEMSLSLEYSNPITPESAIALQENLRTQVILHNDLGEINYVAGVDVGFESEDSISCAAVAVLKYPELTLHEHQLVRLPTTFPYMPGLLAFREVPVVLEALSQLKTKPDLLLCDGNGYIHPRRFGFACHLGVISNIPSIGVAKTPYVGEHGTVGNNRGDWEPIYDNHEIIGAALRTQTNVKPVYVSIGHRISLESAITYVLECTPKYRLPETTRWADHIASGHSLTMN
jgi:deoxyribonuclease V